MFLSGCFVSFPDSTKKDVVVADDRFSFVIQTQLLRRRQDGVGKVLFCCNNVTPHLILIKENHFWYSTLEAQKYKHTFSRLRVVGFSPLHWNLRNYKRPDL